MPPHPDRVRRNYDHKHECILVYYDNKIMKQCKLCGRLISIYYNSEPPFQQQKEDQATGLNQVLHEQLPKHPA